MAAGRVPLLKVNPLAPQTGSRERVTLVHDYLLVMRGAERTFAAMADLYRRADLHPALRRARHRRTLCGALDHHLAAPAPGRRPDDVQAPAAPLSARRRTLEAAALGRGAQQQQRLRPRRARPEGAVHVCYCHAPFRYAWYEQARALGEIAPPLRPLLRLQLRRMRRWDLAASRRVDSYIANSAAHPRADQALLRPRRGDHPPAGGDPPLRARRARRRAAGRLGDRAPQARAGRAWRRRAARGVPIRVVGSGPDHAALSEAYPEAEFLGRASDEDLVELYASARAVVVPSMEEFGITAVEAQAAGRPVIAAAAGGALETVLDGQTGRLARLDDVESFVAAIKGIDALDFDPARAVQNAERFSVAAFRRSLSEYVSRAVESGGESD